MKKRDDIFISQIQHRMALIAKYLKGISKTKFLGSDLHQAAVIRELEVIGEAAKVITDDTKVKFPRIPWREMIGMRNRLIHEYFSTDPLIVWNVASLELPKLQQEIERAFLHTAPPVHPWRHCPSGYYFVRQHERMVDISDLNPDGNTSVREHCRKNPSGKDQLYPHEMKWIEEGQRDRMEQLSSKVGKLTHPKNANDFDAQIGLWTEYWNALFKTEIPLDPDFVKALFFSESSFDLKVKDQRISSRNLARGPMQITDATRKILSSEKGELENHFINLGIEDVRDPSLAIAASIRWLFYKRDWAAKYLGRKATWEESIAAYKGYLKRNKDFTKSKGMIVFTSALARIKNGH